MNPLVCPSLSHGFYRSAIFVYTNRPTKANALIAPKEAPKEAPVLSEALKNVAVEHSHDELKRYLKEHPKMARKLFPEEEGFNHADEFERIRTEVEKDVLEYLAECCAGPDGLNKINTLDVPAELKMSLMAMAMQLTRKTAYQLAKKNCENWELRKRVYIDDLTRIPNKRAFRVKLKEEIARAGRNGPFCFAIMDIDLFKEVNDVHGHLAGDDALSAVAQIMNQEVVRTSDFAARYGGEEFVIIFTNTRPDQAIIAMHRISEEVKKRVYEVRSKKEGVIQIPISVSIAGASFGGVQEDPTGQEMIRQADSDLYVLKGKEPDKHGFKGNRRGGVAFGGEVISREAADAMHEQGKRMRAVNQIDEMHARLAEHGVVVDRRNYIFGSLGKGTPKNGRSN